MGTWAEVELVVHPPADVHVFRPGQPEPEARVGAQPCRRTSGSRAG